jgi:tol-pal system protein YbgF
LLSDKKYPEAATALDAFVKKYPSDPLTSNAYYWLGESYYARADYTRAAESFRKGFEQNPTAQKAADNLYKLALSLNQVKRTSEACIVLSQVIGKYADKSARTVAKAVEQRNVMQCK